jgi:hypothetical protein
VVVGCLLVHLAVAVVVVAMVMAGCVLLGVLREAAVEVVVSCLQ